MALLAGPRLGLGTDPSTSFKVWAQYNSASLIEVEYRITGDTTWITGPSGTPDTGKSSTIVLEVTGLQINTRYDYRLVEGGVPDTAYWTRTFNTSGRVIFYQTSDHHNNFSDFDYILTDFATFDALGIPGFVFCGGDFYAQAGTSASKITRVSKYKTALAITNVFKFLPGVFMWDDHDFAGNNSSPDIQPDAFDSDVPPDVWDTIWRDQPKPLTDTFGFSQLIHDIPFILCDTRSARASQTGLVPSLLGNEIVSDFATCLGAEQRAWAKARIAEYSDRGLVFMATGSQFLEHIITVTDQMQESTRDSFGLYYKSERNELMTETVRFGYSTKQSMFIMVGDDHRHALWTNVDFPPELRQAIYTETSPNTGKGLGANVSVISVCSSGFPVVGGSRTLFGLGNRYDLFSAKARVIRWDITSAHGGRNVTARFTYVNLLDQVEGEADSDGQIGDFYFDNGRVTTFDVLTSGIQTHPAENSAHSGIRFQRSYVDDVQGGIYYEDSVQRDYEGRLREHVDIDLPSPDQLREGWELPNEIDDDLDPLE